MNVCHLRSLLSLLALAVPLACTTGNSSVTPAASESCAASAYAAAMTALPGGVIIAPKVIRRVEPIAPRSLMGRNAVATVDAVIGVDGKARHICVSSGDPLWGQAVAAALAHWQFEPGTADGKAAPVLFSITTKWTSR